jgi:ubiquinone/menaquinone biosynthesis C-methylase UbiE
MSSFDSVEYEPFPNEEGRNSRQERIEIPALVRALGLPSGSRVLEVGCGRGVALPVLAELCQPSRLVGLDVDPALLDEAQPGLSEAGARCEQVCADVREMPFEDASFDVVIDFGTLYHIARPANGLSEIARVLRPGGVFVEETRLSQALAHPIRSRGRQVPWRLEGRLRRRRSAGLWASHLRVDPQALAAA